MPTSDIAPDGLRDLHFPAGGPPNLFISEALDHRADDRSNHVAEAAAIRAFAIAVADEPDALLPRYVELALQLTGAISGGYSLWEREPSPGVFRWRFLKGALSSFVGATTPRNYSPCGITLDRNEPVLCRHPERAYTWLVDAGVVLPEVLLVPLRQQSGEPFGTLWVVSDVEGVFTREQANTLSQIAAYTGVAAARHVPAVET